MKQYQISQIEQDFCELERNVKLHEVYPNQLHIQLVVLAGEIEQTLVSVHGDHFHHVIQNRYPSDKERYFNDFRMLLLWRHLTNEIERLTSPYPKTTTENRLTETVHNLITLRHQFFPGQ